MITIYGELYSSKNSRMIVKSGNKMVLLKSSACRKHIKPLEQQLILNRYKWLDELKTHQKPYRICFKIYRKTKRRFDYINIIQQLQDSMVRCLWIEDDNADIMIPVFKPYEIDSNNPRVQIEVLNEDD